MARQERAEQTRNAILSAAASRFDADGFLGASLSDILSEAGVTKGALYFHFKAKEDLADALIAEQFGTADPITSPENPGLQTLIDWSHNLATALQTDVRVRAGIRLVIEQGSYVSPAHDAYTRWIELSRTCLLAARAAGDLQADVDPDDLATFLVGAFTGIQLSSQVLTGRADLSDRVTFLWRTILGSVVPPRRRRKFTVTKTPTDADSAPAA